MISTWLLIAWWKGNDPARTNRGRRGLDKKESSSFQEVVCAPTDNPGTLNLQNRRSKPNPGPQRCSRLLSLITNLVARPRRQNKAQARRVSNAALVSLACGPIVLILCFNVSSTCMGLPVRDLVTRVGIIGGPQRTWLLAWLIGAIIPAPLYGNSYPEFDVSETDACLSPK